MKKVIYDKGPSILVFVSHPRRNHLDGVYFRCEHKNCQATTRPICSKFWFFLFKFDASEMIENHFRNVSVSGKSEISEKYYMVL